MKVSLDCELMRGGIMSVSFTLSPVPSIMPGKC